MRCEQTFYNTLSGNSGVVAAGGDFNVGSPYHENNLVMDSNVRTPIGVSPKIPTKVEPGHRITSSLSYFNKDTKDKMLSSER